MATKYRAMYEDSNTRDWAAATKPVSYNAALEEVRRLTAAGLSAMVESTHESKRRAISSQFARRA
jgi:hypothetical protein